MHQHASKVMSAYKRASPKYLELERVFKEKSEREEAEKLKRKLDEIKYQHRPLDPKDLN